MKKEFEYLNEVEMDFSVYEKYTLTEMERYRMKKKCIENKNKKMKSSYTSAAVCLVGILLFMQTSLAQDVMNKIISIGHSSIVVEEETACEKTVKIPEELVGQIYDKQGNVVTELDSDTESIYNENGDAITICEEDGVYFTETIKQAEIEEDNFVHFETIDDLASKLNFKLKVPDYLPAGYELVDAYGFQDENKVMSGDYAVLVYGNGEFEFDIHERRDSEETKFVTSLADPKEMDFGGTTAIYNDSEFDCTWDGTIVSILGRKVISGEDILLIAESMK